MSLDSRQAEEDAPPRSGIVRTALFLVFVAAIELVYALYNPPLHNPDELSHLQNAAWWRDEGTWSDPYAETERIQQDHHPPYAGIVGGLVLKLTEGLFDDAEPLALPGPYDITLEPGRRERVRMSDALAPARLGQLYVLRGIIALHQVLLAFFLLRIADFVWRDRRRFAFAMALACCAIPQVAMNGAALTPDTPLAAFSTAALWFALRAAAGGGSNLRLGIWTGSFFGLALWCKSGAIFLIPTLGVVALLRAHSMRSLRAGLAYLGIAGVVTLIVGGFWYVRNVWLHGDPFHMHVLVETYAFAMRREPATATFVEVTLWDIFRTFFGFWNREILLPRPGILALAGVCGAAALGIALLVRRSVRCEVPRQALVAIPVALTALATLLTLTLMGNFVFPSAQGRYLYPALGGFLVLLGTGLRVAGRMRTDGRMSYVVAAGWIACTFWGFSYSVLSKYYSLHSRAKGEGQVLFYDDCGSPNRQPHLVPGSGLTPPDEGMLGRVVPWRTINGHPVAVVYRFELPQDAPKDDLQVRVTYYNPDPTTPFVAHERGQFVYTTQRLRANGTLLHDEIEITSEPKEFVFPIPKSALDKRAELELKFEKVAGIAACVAEIWIERRWLTVREAGKARIVTNRTNRMLPAICVAGEGAAQEELHQDLGPGDEVRIDQPGFRVALLELASPWMLREAEAHKTKSSRWFGHQAASGGYFLRGEGSVATLPFRTDLEGGEFRARIIEGDEREWKWIQPPGKRDAEGNLDITFESRFDLDYVELIGGLRPGF